jgi:hypothetical protein
VIGFIRTFCEKIDSKDIIFIADDSPNAAVGAALQIFD